MKKTLFVWMTIGVLALMMAGCSIMQAIQLKNCEYQFSKITDVTFLDMNRNERLSVVGIARVTQALLGKTEQVRLGCTIHIRVANPNKSAASVDRVFYTISLDSIQVAEGSTKEPFIVAGQSNSDLALKISVDLKQLLQSKMRNALGRAVKNFLGMSDTPSIVGITLKPIVRVGGTAISIPAPIQIRCQYGGKEQTNTAKLAEK